MDPMLLLRPIPDMTGLRKRKQGYGDVAIDATHPKFAEPLVHIGDYGIAGQAYYSRPNPVTVAPVPGVPADLYLRKSIAETLARINTALQNTAITEFFGGAVELYVEDALRPLSLQRRLHDELVPALLRKNHPEMSEEEIAGRLRDIIALQTAYARVYCRVHCTHAR